jgi:hypothetical protein
VLKDAFLAVEHMKQAVLLLSGLGVMAYMQNIEQEQEIMARAADMIAAIYLSESALLRAERLLGSSRGDKATRLARLYTFTALDKARSDAIEALRRMPNGKAMLPKLQAFLAEHGFDLIELRREAAQDAYEAMGYSLS